jgi:hypothetical protein
MADRYQNNVKSTIKKRAKSETDLRKKLLKLHDHAKLYPKTTDAICIKNYVAVFSKALPHDTQGYVDKEQMKLLLKAIGHGDRKYMDQVVLGNPNGMKLVNLLAYASTELFGLNVASFKLRGSPEFKSAEFAADEAEVYEMALCRDVNFRDFTTSPLIADAVGSLNMFSDFKGPKPVTSENLFRGISAGDVIGPYVSQFLYLPFKYGLCDMVQTYHFPQANADYLKTPEDYLKCQNGTVPTPALPFDPVKRYINTPRELAEYVHNDPMCQEYFNAQMILNGLKAPWNPGHPYRSEIKNDAPFVTMGAPDIHDLLHRASRTALHACWLNKVKHLRIRPEVYAYEVNRAKNGENYGVNDEILNSSTLARVFTKFGNYLLPTSYPEGSPAHPAFPSGHASIAGAAVTILKAFYDGSFVFPQAYIANGNVLEPIPDKLTLNNELDKLASNCAYGRNIAGIHYRSDAEEGIKLGEAVAIELLEEHVFRYQDKVALEITKRDGSKVVIKN